MLLFSCLRLQAYASLGVQVHQVQANAKLEVRVKGPKP